MNVGDRFQCFFRGAGLKFKLPNLPDNWPPLRANSVTGSINNSQFILRNMIHCFTVDDVDA